MHPIHLSIKTKNEKSLFESNDESLIKKLIVPHSRSISNIPFKYIKENYQNSSKFVLESASKPMFLLNNFNFSKIIPELETFEELQFSFEAEHTFSSMEVIAMMPINIRNFHKISLVDSILFDFNKVEELIF